MKILLMTLAGLLCLVPPASAQAVETLSFSEFFAPGETELNPSAKLHSLNGKRVRIVGYMAKLADAPPGVFYLCALPVQGDESGGGTADLPVNALRVIVPQLKGKPIEHVARPFAVIGKLELGPQQEDDGTISNLRLVLEPGQPAAKLRTGAPRSQRKTFTLKK